VTAERLPGPRPGELLRAIRARTPARILVGRSGPAYRTATWLELRQDHAAAVDAVRADLDAVRDFGAEFVARWGLFEVTTRAASREEHLLRPDLGRRLSEAARAAVRRECPGGADLQVVIGDGLSAVAVRAQVPPLLPLLDAEARARGLRLGRPFVVRWCRVGVLNDVGELLDPAVAVLLVGERPGLATAESLSAYLAYRPRPGDIDARRNVIANIHARGVRVEDAARRAVALAERLRRQQASGVAVKEDAAAPDEGPARELPPEP
jgi:ethanolamine ammonia-lyase small subunit